jgi:hypothetical protein
MPVDHAELPITFIPFGVKKEMNLEKMFSGNIMNQKNTRPHYWCPTKINMCNATVAPSVFNNFN